MDVYDTAEHCQDCPLMGENFRNKRQLQFFLQRVPLDIDAIDILGLLPRARWGDQFVDLVRDPYSTMTPAVPTPNILSTNVTQIFSK